MEYFFYGRIEALKGAAGQARGPFGNNMSQQCQIVLLRIIRDYDGQIISYPEMGMLGPGDHSSVCHAYGDDVYVYDPYDQSEGDSNFGSVHCFVKRNFDWKRLQIASGNLRVKQPSHNVIFINGVLNLFTDNADQTGRIVEAGSSFIEDVYLLDLQNLHGGAWKRISPVGQVPGAMINISLAEANGMIYVFGTSEGKSVLWVYNISDQEWKQVRNIGTLTAGPDQRAVIYEGKLLIVNWDYSKDSVKIQSLNVGGDDLDFAVFSTSGKEICKDQAEELIQNFKKLSENQLFHDVVFEVEGEEIPAHKALLAYRSDYFMKMFNSGMSESHNAKIPIPNMKSHIFKAILQYIYCNEIELDEQLALVLIPIIDEYSMKGLKAVCEKYLCKQLRKENVVDMLIVADTHKIDELKKACFKYILTNLGNIDENEEMMKLSKSLFFELLKFQTLSLTNNSKPQPKKEEQKLDFFPQTRQLDMSRPKDVLLAKRIRGEKFSSVIL